MAVQWLKALVALPENTSFDLIRSIVSIPSVSPASEDLMPRSGQLGHQDASTYTHTYTHFVNFIKNFLLDVLFPSNSSFRMIPSF